MPEGSHVIIDGSKARTIHTDIHDSMDDFVIKAQNRDVVSQRIGFGPHDTG